MLLDITNKCGLVNIIMYFLVDSVILAITSLVPSISACNIEKLGGPVDNAKLSV